MGVERVLGVMVSGSIQVNANRNRFAHVDAKGKIVDIDISGTRTTGISVTRLIGREVKGVVALYRETQGFAKGLAAQGWRLNLKDADREVLSMGRGVSGVMGPVHIHLFQIGKVLDVL